MHNGWIGGAETYLKSQLRYKIPEAKRKQTPVSDFTIAMRSSHNVTEIQSLEEICAKKKKVFFPGT